MIVLKIGRLAISWLKPVPMHTTGDRPAAVVASDGSAAVYEPLLPGTPLYLHPPKDSK